MYSKLFFLLIHRRIQNTFQRFSAFEGRNMFSTQVGQHFKCIESADLDFFPFESRKRSVSIIALTLLYACRLLIPFSDATDFTKSLLFIVSLLLKMLVHEIIKLLAVQGYVPLSCFPDTLLRTVTHLSRKNPMHLYIIHYKQLTQNQKHIDLVFRIFDRPKTRGIDFWADIIGVIAVAERLLIR